MISCFRCSISMISAQFHCDTSLQCACCVVKLLYYARIISPEYHYRIIFLFSLKAEGRRFDGFVNAGGTVGVSTTNCGVTADGVVYRLDDPWFQCSFNMIFTLDFTVICTSLKCIWYFSLNTCFTMLGWVIYRIIIVSFFFLTEDRGSLTWRLCRRRWHRGLSQRLLAMPLDGRPRALFFALLKIEFLSALFMC